jgi:acetylornithine/N-succinyldiaminopimelate aminotransferase
MSAIMPTYGRLDVTFVRGEGAWLFDAAGTAYLDGVSGIAVTNLGHSHPAVTQAIRIQSEQLLHTSNLYHIPGQQQLASTLTQATGMESVFFCNSGAEANETAIKLARLYGHQRNVSEPKIVVLDGAFHGRTMGALSATGNARIREPFAPLLPGFIRCPRNDIEAVTRASREHPDIVAVHLEPVQGEGGVHALEPGYLRALRLLCDQQGWLLSFDEVQSGNGRCGALFAFERLGVTPDVLATAKGLGNGIPIGACLTRGAASKVLGPGDHGTTFGGSPFACAVGQAVVDTLIDNQLWARADPIRETLLNSFLATLTASDKVRDIRGLGLMIGIELDMDCSSLVQRALEQRLLINVTAGNTVRLLPPLVMSDEDAATLGHGLAGIINKAANTEIEQ